MCFINNTPLITIIDMYMTHSFIFVECVSRLKLDASTMNGNMIIDTLASGSVTTSLVCLNFPLTIFGRYFGMELMCLTLS